MEDIKFDPLKIKGDITYCIKEARRCFCILTDYRCQYCKKKAPETKLHIHHLNGRALDWRIDNLILLCTTCHSKYHTGAIVINKKLADGRIRHYIENRKKAKPTTIRINHREGV